MRLLGLALSTLATILILTVSYSYFRDILPMFAAERGTFVALLTTCVGVWLLGNIVFNYFSAMFVGPGYAPRTLSPQIKEAMVHDPERDAEKPYRYCRKCQAVKPMRTHHCSLCNKCVLKMDHHCPWVNNCVGWKNQRYFLLFLVYLWAGSLFYLIVGKDQVYRTLFGRSRSTMLLVSCTMCFSAFLATSLFLLWNAVLLFTNQTTIEFWANWLDADRRGMKHEYNLGTWRNVKEVFGLDTNYWNWLRPIRANPPGHGVLFPMMHKGKLVMEHPKPKSQKRQPERGSLLPV